MNCCLCAAMFADSGQTAPTLPSKSSAHSTARANLLYPDESLSSDEKSLTRFYASGVAARL